MDEGNKIQNLEKLHNLNGQTKIGSSCQFPMKQVHQCWMQPRFSIRTTWFCLGWIRRVWIVLENFLRKWILFFILLAWMIVSSGRSGHKNAMFCLFIKILLALMVKTHLSRINRILNGILLVLPARTPSTLWPIFWDWHNAVQCAKRNVSFMLSLFVMEPANLLVLFGKHYVFRLLWCRHCFVLSFASAMSLAVFASRWSHIHIRGSVSPTTMHSSYDWKVKQLKFFLSRWFHIFFVDWFKCQVDWWPPYSEQARSMIESCILKLQINFCNALRCGCKCILIFAFAGCHGPWMCSTGLFALKLFCSLRFVLVFFLFLKLCRGLDLQLDRAGRRSSLLGVKCLLLNPLLLLLNIDIFECCDVALEKIWKKMCSVHRFFCGDREIYPILCSESIEEDFL